MLSTFSSLTYFFEVLSVQYFYHQTMNSSAKLPGQKDDENENEFISRILKRVDDEYEQESKVPERFFTMKLASTLTHEHPAFKTTNHEYGKLPVTEYERPSEYHTVSRKFTETQHMGLNFEGANLNVRVDD